MTRKLYKTWFFNQTKILLVLQHGFSRICRHTVFAYMFLDVVSYESKQLFLLYTSKVCVLLDLLLIAVKRQWGMMDQLMG